MNVRGSGAAMLNVAVLVGLAVLSYVVFPGNDGLMIAVGILAGYSLATLTFGRQIGARATIPKVLGVFVSIVVAAFAIPGVIGNQLAKADLGDMSAGILTLSRALGGLLWGVALRQLWNARKLIR